MSASRDVEVFLVAVDALEPERGLLPELAERFAEASIVLFGSRPDIDALIEAAPAHVRGYLTFNHLSDEEFARSLDIIAHGGAVIEPLSAALLLEYLAARPEQAAGPHVASASTELTAREEEVVEYVQRGLSNKEIAMEMSISLGTVRAHLRSIFRKLEVSSRAGAAAKSLGMRPQRERHSA
jgi:DNA-binding NarL/FixJ family response regulator